MQVMYLKLPTFILMISVYYDMPHFIVAYDMSGILGLTRSPVSESNNSFTLSSTMSLLTLTQGEVGHIVP